MNGASLVLAQHLTADFIASATAKLWFEPATPKYAELLANPDTAVFVVGTRLWAIMFANIFDVDSTFWAGHAGKAIDETIRLLSGEHASFASRPGPPCSFRH